MTSSFPGKNRSPIDQLISEFDTALRSIAGGAHYRRPIPKTELDNDLKPVKSGGEYLDPAAAAEAIAAVGNQGKK